MTDPPPGLTPVLMKMLLIERELAAGFMWVKR